MTPTRLRIDTIARLRTIGVTEQHPAPTFNVLDSRTTSLAPGDLPAIMVATPSATISSASLSGGRWMRDQQLRIVAEFEAQTDEALALAADTIELAVWGALMGHQAWVRLWDHPKSWKSEFALDAKSERRRGVLSILIEGDFGQYSPEPDDLTPLHEIRAAVGIDGHVDGEGNPDPKVETRVPCDGAPEE